MDSVLMEQISIDRNIERHEKCFSSIALPINHPDNDDGRECMRIEVGLVAIEKPGRLKLGDKKGTKSRL
ncbi:hypothetical protein CHS0354_033269 [Potamilus streckersoni]|uniref:Uncharacterized protein n=1 Tax=Potamilus streckersoni TaxID=2493646 RepID=A0AAE0S6E5_9BIVA|nr:hypothetical protein CHS0354_033269 [Potamilus streckersoni]